MSTQRMLRGTTAILLAWGLTWAMSSCASAPPKAVEPPPATKPVSETPAPAVQTAPEPVSEAAFQAARDAIAEAEAAEAEKYAPELLNQAREALKQAQDKAIGDPDGARVLLKTSVDKAHEARDAARKALMAANQKAMKDLLDGLDQQARQAIAEAEAAGAPKYAPELLGQAREALTQAQAKGTSSPEEAVPLYQAAIDKAHAAAAASKIKALLDGLDSTAQKAIAEAVDAGAEQWAAEGLKQAREALLQAQGLVSSSTPEQALVPYQTSIDKAHQARDAAYKAALSSLDQAAQQAIAEAEAAEADLYSPALLEEARKALLLGREKVESAPEVAKASFLTATDKANAARDASRVARTQSLLEKLAQATARLKALQPEQWDAEGTTAVLAQAEVARTAVEADYATGLPLASAALTALDSATAKLSARLQAVLGLKGQAQTALDEAEAVEAYIWVPEMVQSANDAFFQGTGAWKKFRLDGAEEAWSTALFQAKAATAKAQGEMERRRTEQLMLETMKKLEDASGKTVVDPQDNIIAPSPWDGKKELEKLKTKPVSVLIPADGTTVVLGEKQRITYLDEAKDQWAQGVRALEAGDLPLANEAFLQAQKLIDTYLEMAVDKIYTVRLIPDRRDSLWRISEYDGIYATPWEWPKIWKRNQKLIQNPDLIYPGWQLIIPPQ